MANTKKPETPEDKPKTAKASEDHKKTAPKAETKEAAAAPKTDKAAAKKADKPKGKSGPKNPRAPLMPKTFYAEHAKLTEWKLVDASGQHLGRISSYIAQLLMGKTKPSYTRHHDTGDAVVVINAEKVKLTGNKWAQKVYQHHTNYPGGIKTHVAKDVLEDHPERLIEKAVYRMLPTGHMGRRWRNKLLIYKGTEHPHKAQKPQPVKLPDLGSWN